jgi:hypothetical protein
MGGDSSVSRVINYGLHGLFPAGTSPLHADRSPTQWVPGALSPGIKRRRREADHPPTSSARLRTRGTLPPFPLTPLWRGALLSTGKTSLFHCQ